MTTHAAYAMAHALSAGSQQSHKNLIFLIITNLRARILNVKVNAE